MSDGQATTGEAVLVGDGLADDAIFRLDSPGNRDGCYEPYVLLAARFRAAGIALHTPDRLRDTPVFELHMDVCRPRSDAPCFLMLFETPLVRPANAGIPDHYRAVFTWDDSRVDGRRFVKFNFPNPLTVPAADGFAHRDRFCCLVAGNKAAAHADPRELYSERVRAIRWYEAHAPADFDLYGTGWDRPPARPGLAGRLQRRVWRWLPATGSRPFPSWRGTVARKRDVLQRTRFAICYENVRGLPGYITEKLFDCFFAGCVPVYLGADNIADHVPADCFIDRRRFAGMAELHAHLRAMDEATYRGYQQRIAAFLRSEAARPFGSEAFADTVASTVLAPENASGAQRPPTVRGRNTG